MLAQLLEFTTSRRLQRPLQTQCVETLESRVMPAALSIVSITRTASMSLLSQQIRDVIPLTVGMDSIKTGSTQALVGYQVPSAFGGMASLGGMGLEIIVTKVNVGDTVQVTVNWGDGSPVNTSNSTNPLFVFPHSYLSPGPYTIEIHVVSGADSVDARVIANIDYVMENAQGAYIRGRNLFDDTVSLGQLAGGALKVTANFLAAPYTTQPGQLPVFIDTLGGNDVVEADAGVTRALWVDGGKGNDRVKGGAGDDRLRGADGSDWLYGDAGDDLLFGDAGPDTLFGGAGDDLLHGGSNHDVIKGGPGSDALFGDAGSDQLSGNRGNDFLLGGLGPDWLYGNLDNDVLVGGYDNTNYEIDWHGILAAWAHFNDAKVTRILTSAVTYPATDLSPVPNTMTAQGETEVAAGQFGPAIGNDAAIDNLVSGPGRSYLAPSIVSGRADNDSTSLSGGPNTVKRLTDTPVTTINVQRLLGVQTTSGADVIASPTRNVYVYGRYDTDTSGVISGLGYPSIAEADFYSWYGVPRASTLTTLNLNSSLGGDAFWSQFNRPYVALGLAFRGKILVVSDLFDPMNYTSINVDGSINPLPGRRREFDYLRGFYDPALHPTSNGQSIVFHYDAMRKQFFAAD